MLDWFRNLAGFLGRTVDDAFDYARRIVEAVWHKLTDVGHLINRAWDAMVRAAMVLGALVPRIAGSLYQHARYILTQVIPHAVRWVIGKAYDFARTMVGRAVDFLRGIIGKVRDWAAEFIRRVLDFARSVLRYLGSILDRVRDTLGRVARIVFDLLTHPERLATWLAPALWGPIWRWLRSHASAIAGWFLGHLVRTMLAAANVIEGIVSDVL